MKSKFANLNFEGVEVLSKEETKKVKGGYANSQAGAGQKIMCGYTLYYPNTPPVSGIGSCICNTVWECEQIQQGSLTASHPGVQYVTSHGCWTVG